jgi:hypothetical protein
MFLSHRCLEKVTLSDIIVEMYLLALYCLPTGAVTAHGGVYIGKFHIIYKVEFNCVYCLLIVARNLGVVCACFASLPPGSSALF